MWIQQTGNGKTRFNSNSGIPGRLIPEISRTSYRDWRASGSNKGVWKLEQGKTDGLLNTASIPGWSYSQVTGNSSQDLGWQIQPIPANFYPLPFLWLTQE